jgi:spindle assembly abnormal protein 6
MRCRFAHQFACTQHQLVAHAERLFILRDSYYAAAQVGEDDYHQLKHDQRLRVDFKAFPRQFIELLEGCAEHSAAAATSSDSTAAPSHSAGQRQGQSQGAFLARLEAPPSNNTSSSNSYGTSSISSSSNNSSSAGLSTFSLVETNHFKELTHLSLRFRAGNDSAVKAYLAARLRQLRAEGAALATQLSDTDSALCRERQAAAAAVAEVEHLRTSRERDLRDLR